MQRVNIQKARRLFESGATIYFIPADVAATGYLPQNNYSNKTLEKDFDTYLKKFKEFIKRNVHYYVDMNEIELQERNKNNKMQRYKITSNNKTVHLQYLEVIHRLSFAYESAYGDDWNCKFEITFSSKFLPEVMLKNEKIGVLKIERL